ncbi:MAG: T9SS type A sorting domain-containing protein [Saprospiraceae bacterium]
MRLWLIIIILGHLCVLSTTAQTGCQVRGIDGNWSSGPDLMGSPPSVVVNVSGRQEFKIYCSGNNTWYPGGNNAWTNGGGNVNFIVLGGNAMSAEAVINFSICSPGDFSGWDNSAAMTQDGNQWCYTVPNTGTYQWKPVKCGSWDSWWTTGQRDVNAGNWFITTTAPNQKVCVNYDPVTGQVGTAFLPVSWLEFQVIQEQQQNIITWKTAQELNNEYFEVLHSIDGKVFETVGMIIGSGTTSSQKDYSFHHDIQQSPISFYKIKQVDFDGKSSYSDIRFVKNEARSYTIYPNPSLGTFFITGLENKIFDVVVFDSNGKKLYSALGKQQSTLDLGHLESGLMFVTITESGFTYHFKVVKI